MGLARPLRRYTRNAREACFDPSGGGDMANAYDVIVIGGGSSWMGGLSGVLTVTVIVSTTGETVI